MVADAPQPIHHISTAAISSRPRRLRGLTITIEWGYQYGLRVAPKGCRAEHSQVTLAGRILGVEAMMTYWCPR